MAILASALAAAVLWLAFLLLRRDRAVRRAARSLRDNPARRLRLEGPDPALEELLAQINRLLDEKERESRALRSGEQELRRQIANVSHDLRTPLTSILGYLQLLENSGLPPEERREYLGIIRGRAQALQTLITSFYDLSRLEAGEYPITMEDIQLYPILAKLMAEFYNDLEEAGMEVELSLAEQLPPVRGDANASLRLMGNLVQNALKHGAGRLSVTLEARGDGQVVSFSNDAPELTEEDVRRVFERFYTADKMRTGRNTGLGLAIVRELARRMELPPPAARLEDGRFTVEVRWRQA